MAELQGSLQIDPNYIDAYINYGNLLKAYMKQPDKGNSYYLKAKELDKHGHYKDIIDLLIKNK